MEDQTEFRWQLCITAPRGYSVEVYRGYLSTDSVLASSIINIGIESVGWTVDGTTCGGGSSIPTKLSLTYLSYVDKKFMKVEANLPADTMLALFRKGFMFTDRLNVTSHVTYNGITIGLAPGGMVVVWLVGDFKRTEVCRLQAKEVFVDVNSFSHNSQNFSQEAFLQFSYDHFPSKEVLELIKTEGIPYGLWDDYRIHYNYKFRFQFYKADKEEERHSMYFSGEEEIIKGEALNSIGSKAIPFREEFSFEYNWAEAEFNDEELMAAFKELTKANKDEPLEIVGKVGFMYKDIAFVVKNKDKEIPLKKVEVAFWGYQNGKYE